MFLSITFIVFDWITIQPLSEPCETALRILKGEENPETLFNRVTLQRGATKARFVPHENKRLEQLSGLRLRRIIRANR